MSLYRRMHEMVLMVLIIGILNIYDLLKNVNISVYNIININEKNIIYLLLITLFFFFIFFNTLGLPLEFELILGLGLIALYFILLTNDFILFFLALELYSLSVYLLLFKNDLPGARITILYFLLGSISSSFILLGIAIIYYKTGSLDISFILQNLEIILNYHNTPFSLFFGLTLILFGLLFKLGSAPFQFWVIRVYTQMKIKVLIYQSIVPKIVYTLVLYNLLYNLNSPTFSPIVFKFLLFSAFLSLFVGPIGGLNYGVSQFKTILAYSSILHVGYLLLGLASNTFETPVLFLNIFQYLLIYGLNTIHFFMLFVLIEKTNKVNLNKPLLFLFLLISIFSFIGLPPFAGFYAKLNILFNCLNSNTPLLGSLSILFIIVSTLIATFLYLKFINFVYFQQFNTSFICDRNFHLYYSYLVSFISILLFSYPLFLPYFSPFFELFSI